MKAFKERIFKVIQIGSKYDLLSRIFDAFIVATIAVNLFVTIFDTFDESLPYKGVLNIVELITIIIFTVEYVLRVWTSDLLYDHIGKAKSAFKFIFSFYGLIDLLSFLPYYLPIFFPAGMVAFRMFRVIRIFRLFKINTRYDAFNVITGVLNEKKNQILSSVSMVLILMIASSLVMYSLEHEAQPENFKNAFSGIWWSASTLLTVGYGDIYPVTIPGKVMAIVISFLGVGMVAIPTGIISAGFVEQYQKIKNNYLDERDIKFVSGVLNSHHKWVGQKLKDVVLPPDVMVVMVLRDNEVKVPRGDFNFMEDDMVVLGAKHFEDPDNFKLSEVYVSTDHPWIDLAIKDIKMEAQELVVMIERMGTSFVPNGSSKIKAGDKIIIYEGNV